MNEKELIQGLGLEAVTPDVRDATQAELTGIIVLGPAPCAGCGKPLIYDGVRWMEREPDQFVKHVCEAVPWNEARFREYLKATGRDSYSRYHARRDAR